MDLSTLTPGQIAGQRIMAGFRGTVINDELKHLISTVKVGGIILFSRNIENAAQLRALCADAQTYAASVGQPPLLIAVDQEGGAVARLKAPEFTEFSGAPAMKDITDAISFSDTTAAELNSAGINMNMAPVLDVAPEGVNSIMADRIYGRDPERVAEMGAAIIDRLQQGRVMAVAKHFPGIGRTTSDSHIDRPDLDASLAELESFDLIPFKTAIAHRVSGIMLSHIRYTTIDPQWPASLSITIARDLLRDQLGYTGLVMTDDLDMGAIRNHYDSNTVIDRILESDIDIALICHTTSFIETAASIIADDFTRYKDENSRHFASLARIMHLKWTCLQ